MKVFIILFSLPTSKEGITIELFSGEKRTPCFGDREPIPVREHPGAVMEVKPVLKMTRQ